jgi:hypothetical protein
VAKILKWTVPIDDKYHEVGGGPVVHVASQYGKISELQVWTQESRGTVPHRLVKVVGTGYEFHESGIALGSAIVSDGGLVWHLVEFKEVAFNGPSR